MISLGHMILFSFICRVHYHQLSSLHEPLLNSTHVKWNGKMSLHLVWIEQIHNEILLYLGTI